MLLKSVEVNHLNEIKNILENDAKLSIECFIDSLFFNRKFKNYYSLTYEVTIDKIIYSVQESYTDRKLNSLEYRNVYKVGKIKNNNSIHRYMTHNSVNCEVLRDKIVNKFPKRFDVHCYYRDNEVTLDYIEEVFNNNKKRREEFMNGSSKVKALCKF